MALLSTAQARGPKASRDADYQMAVTQAHQRYQDLGSGQVASDPPVLATATPELFGIVIVRIDGKVFHAGNAEAALLLDSVAPAYAAALLAEQQGADVVTSTAGAVAGTAPLPNARGTSDWGKAPGPALEPAGSLSLLSLLQPQGNPDAKWQALRENLGRFAGHPVDLDPAVHQAGSAGADELKSKARGLARDGRLADDPQATADLFLRQSLVQVSTRDLAVMAATLANDGVNPLTRDRAVKAEVAKSTVSLLIDSGARGAKKAWLGKSGVGVMTSRSGAVVLVVPGRLGIATYSPPLDSKGVSVRGERAMRYLIKVLMIAPDPSRS